MTPLFIGLGCLVVAGVVAEGPITVRSFLDSVFTSAGAICVYEYLNTIAG